MRKFLVITIILSIISALIALPVMAAVSFSQNITLTETGATTFTDLPMGVAFNTASIVSGGYMAANGLDSSVYDNGTALPTMFTNSSILFVDSLDPTGSSGSTITDVLKTGQTPKSSMPIIVGNNGYVTTADNAALEPGNNFSIVASGYLNTTAGASENIVSKTSALVVNVDPSVSGTIDATPSTVTTQSQLNNQSSQYLLYSGSTYSRLGNRYTSLSPNTVISSIQWLLQKFGSPTGTITCNIYNSSNNALLGTLGTYDAASVSTGSANPYTFNTTPINIGAVTDIRIDVEFSGGDASDYIRPCYATSGLLANISYTAYNGSWTDTGSRQLNYQNLTTVLGGTVSVSGVSSGVHTIICSETTAAGGTLSLQVDSGTPSTVTGVGSVPDTANNWIIDQNNVMPYVTSYVETVSGVEKLKFQPNTIVSGTTLVDRDGTQNGVITFGANSGITITYGGIVSQVTNGATAGGSGLSGFNVSPAGAPQSLLSNGSNLTGAYGNNSTIWGVVASFMGSVQTAGQIPPQSQLGFVYLGCVLVLMLVLIKNGVQSMFFIVILIIAALGFGAGVGILAGWVAIIATIIMIGLLYSFKQYG